MEKIYKLELTFEEAMMLYAGLGLFHKETAKALYETLEGLREKKEEVNVDEFDKHHKMAMGLYEKFKDILSEEVKNND